MTLKYKHKATTKPHQLSWVSCIALLLMLFGTFQTKAQLSVTTTGSFLNNNGSGGVTFNLRNNNSFPIIITGIEDFTDTSDSGSLIAFHLLLQTLTR